MYHIDLTIELQIRDHPLNLKLGRGGGAGLWFFFRSQRIWQLLNQLSVETKLGKSFVRIKSFGKITPF